MTLGPCKLLPIWIWVFPWVPQPAFIEEWGGCPLSCTSSGLCWSTCGRFGHTSVPTEAQNLHLSSAMFRSHCAASDNLFLLPRICKIGWVGPFSQYYMNSVKINSQWIVSLNIRTKTVRLLKENRRVSLGGFRLDSWYDTKNTSNKQIKEIN
jgi:hypothetical protein